MNSCCTINLSPKPFSSITNTQRILFNILDLKGSCEGIWIFFSNLVFPLFAPFSKNCLPISYFMYLKLLLRPQIVILIFNKIYIFHYLWAWDIIFLQIFLYLSLLLLSQHNIMIIIVGEKNPNHGLFQNKKSFIFQLALFFVSFTFFSISHRQVEVVQSFIISFSCSHFLMNLFIENVCQDHWGKQKEEIFFKNYFLGEQMMANVIFIFANIKFHHIQKVVNYKLFWCNYFFYNIWD